MTIKTNDYSLLRPFDLEKAKAGWPVCWIDGDFYIKSIIDADNYCAIGRNKDGNVGMWDIRNIRMQPLCWVEGKPVYKGDVLYLKAGLCKGQERIVDHVERDQVLYFTSVTYIELLEVNRHLTWNIPKVKREGWVNIYQRCSLTPVEQSAETSNVYATRMAADKGALQDRLACICVEWEE